MEKNPDTHNNVSIMKHLHYPSEKFSNAQCTLDESEFHAFGVTVRGCRSFATPEPNATYFDA